MHDYRIPIGPQHPSGDEPSCLRVSLDGDTIVDSDLRFGYAHKGIEKLLEGKRIEQGLHIVDHVCGICLPGNEEIILGNGEIVQFKELLDPVLPKKNKDLLERMIFNGKVLSWNVNSTDLGQIVEVQRIPSPKKLIQIKTKSGSVLHFTNPHKILVDTNNGQELIACAQLKVGNLLYAPRKIDIIPSVYHEIDFIPEYFVSFMPEKYIEIIKTRLKQRYGTLKNSSKKLNVRHGKLSRLGSQKLNIKEMKILCSSTDIRWDDFKKDIKEVSWVGTTVKLDRKTINEDFMYLLGLLASDGHIPLWRTKKKNRDYRISFINKNKNLIKTFIKIHKRVFPNLHVEKPKKLKGGALIVRTSNPILSYAALKLGIVDDNKKPDIKPIFKLSEKLIAAFLKGYFDGDGTCSIRKSRRGSHSISITLYTTSELIAKRLKQLLQRVGIATSLKSSSSKGFKRGTRYSITATNKLDILRFISTVNTSHPEKKKKLREVNEFYSTHKTFSSYFMRAPKICASLFKRLRKKYNIPLKEFKTHRSNIFELEGGRNALKTTFKKYLKVIEKHARKNDEDVEKLKEQLSDDFFLDPVLEIKEVDSKRGYVYDMTVKNHHNFIPSGAFVVGNCSVAHPSCYVRVIEKMLKYEPPERVKYLRTLVSELGRIQSHIFWTGFMLHELGFETMLAYFLRDREHILEVLERLTGNRSHFAYHKIRTVKNDVSEGDIRFILSKIREVEKKIPVYMKTIRTDSVIKARMKGVGTITRIDAERYSLLGPIARASGVKVDVRKDDPYEGYDQVDFELIREWSGDAYGRMLVRMREILESIKIIKQVLKNMPQGKIPPSIPVLIDKGMEMGRVEAPRGENFHLIKIRNKKIDRIRIRPPTFNFMSVFTKLLEGKKVGDIPVILASLDPCYACMERVVVIKDGKREVLTEDDFRHKYA